MRSLYLWLMIVTVICIGGGCCKSPRLDPSQTPVAVAKDQRVEVRPLRGGESRRVTVPAGYVIVEPAPPELPR
jgi:hypothetical protein